jgi:hypothetical protein
MASAVRKLTGVGGDIRKIARLLQKEAPPGHMLAYINQEEADLLKARGGSGEPHADTGVPSFDTWGSDSSMSYVPPDQSYTEAIPPQEGAGNVAPLDLTSTQAPAYQTLGDQKYIAGQSAPSAVDMSAVRDTANPLFPEYQQYLRGQSGTSNAQIAASDAAAAAPQSADGTDKFVPAGATKPDFYAENRALNAGTPTKPGFWEGMTDDTKARLGIAGVQGVLGAYSAQQAAEQGRKAKEDLMNLAKPYQDQGKKLIAQAQSGELTPAAQQTLQAAQAQAAQGAQARGGVGAQQAQAQVEALRQQLLQNQYDYGLKVSGIGDNIATGAIRTGLEADRYVNQLTNSYFTNIARTAYGQAPQVAGSPTYVREA